MERKELLALRRRIQVIFQDPYSSLNPRMKVGDIIGEPIEGARHRAGCDKARGAGARTAVGVRAGSALRRPLSARNVGRAAPARRHRPRAGAEPRVHRLRRAGVGAGRVDPGAGGQPARGSARAVRPDLSVHRARPVGGAASLPARRGDVSRPHRRAGGRRRAVRQSAAPYTQALLAAVPVPDPSVETHRTFRPVQGEVPSPINPPSGCVFHPRCPIAVESCKRARPELRELRPGHFVACSEVRLRRAGCRRRCADAVRHRTPPIRLRTQQKDQAEAARCDRRLLRRCSERLSRRTGHGGRHGGDDAEARRHPDLHDPGGCAAEPGWPPREARLPCCMRLAPFYSVLMRVNPENPSATTQFVCDLCTAIPKPTDDGKTYTFKIRDGREVPRRLAADRRRRGGKLATRSSSRRQGV